MPKSKKLLKFTLNDGTDRKRTILSGIHEYYEPEELVGKTAIAIVNLAPRKMMGIDSEGMLISAVHEEDGHEGLNLLLSLIHISDTGSNYIVAINMYNNLDSNSQPGQKS